MALIKCKKCGEMISDKAKRCPHCIKKEEKREKIIQLTSIAVGTIMALVALLVSLT